MRGGEGDSPDNPSSGEDDSPEKAAYADDDDLLSCRLPRAQRLFARRPRPRRRRAKGDRGRGESAPDHSAGHRVIVNAWFLPETDQRETAFDCKIVAQCPPGC